MTEPNPIPSALEAKLKVFLPEWKKRCNAVQEALYWLNDLQSDASEIRDDERAKSLPENLSALLGDVSDLDLNDFEGRLLEVEPDFEKLGALGTEIAETTLSARAMAKWRRSGGARCSAHAAVYHKDSRRFVEIWDDGGHTLAVYRECSYGDLRRLPQTDWGDPKGSYPQCSWPGRKEAPSSDADFIEDGSAPAPEPDFISEDEDRNSAGGQP